MNTPTSRTVVVVLEVASESAAGWRVRPPGTNGRGTFLSNEHAVRLSPRHASPARFRVPVWCWAKLRAVLELPG